MSFLDKAKATAEQAKTAAQQAASKIESSGLVEKAASFVDDKTKGKYADQIAKAQEQAKSAVSKVAKAS